MHLYGLYLNLLEELEVMVILNLSHFGANLLLLLLDYYQKLFAAPAGIIGAGFVEEIENIKNEEINVERSRALLKYFNLII